MKFTPKKTTTKTTSNAPKIKPTVEIGAALFLRSLIGLPYRALSLPILNEENKDSTLGKEIVRLIKNFELEDLFDSESETEMKSFDYHFDRFKKSIEFMKNADFKASAQLFVDSVS